MEGSGLKGQSRNAQTLQYWTPKWALNARKNGPLVERDFRKENINKWGYPDGISLERIPKRLGRGAVVVAGGASLNWVAQDLKALQEEGLDIICGISTLSVCLHHDVKPFAVVCVDANKVVWDEQVKEWAPKIEALQIPLILHPCVDPVVARSWPGPRWWFLPEQVGVPIFDIMHTFYPEITCHMLNAGCVANSQVEICDLLGHKFIFLAGVDFGFTEDMFGATLYRPDGSSWERHHYLVWSNNLRLTDSGTYTTEEMLAYQMNFHLVVRMNYTQVARLTPHPGREAGIMREIPLAIVDEVLKNWEGVASSLWLSEVQIVERANLYLRAQGMDLCINEKGQPQLMFFAENDPTLMPTCALLRDERQKALEQQKKEEQQKQPKSNPHVEVPEHLINRQSPMPSSQGVMQVRMTQEQLQEMLNSGAARPVQ